MTCQFPSLKTVVLRCRRNLLRQLKNNSYQISREDLGYTFVVFVQRTISYALTNLLSTKSAKCHNPISCCRVETYNNIRTIEHLQNKTYPLHKQMNTNVFGCESGGCIISKVCVLFVCVCV